MRERNRTSLWRWCRSPRQLDPVGGQRELSTEAVDDRLRRHGQPALVGDQHLAARTVGAGEDDGVPPGQTGRAGARDQRAIGFAHRHDASDDLGRGDEAVQQRGGLGVHDAMAGPLGNRHQAGGHGRADQGPDAVDRGHVDVVDVGGRDQPLPDGPEGVLATGLGRLGPGQAGHSGHDEDEEQGRDGADHPGVVGEAGRGGLPHEQTGRSQRRRAQDEQGGDAEVLLPPGLLDGQLAHRGVQGRRAPAQVEQHPADVGRTTGAPGAVELYGAIGHVGGEEAEGADGQQHDGAVAQDTVGEQPDEDAEDGDVAQGIVDRDELLEQRHIGGVHVGLDEIHPGQQGGGRGDDERVEQRPEVLLPVARPDHADQAAGQKRRGGQIEEVGDGRKRIVLMEDVGEQVVDDVAGHEGGQGKGDEEPRPLALRPVLQRPDDHRGRCTEAESAPEDEVILREGKGRPRKDRASYQITCHDPPGHTGNIGIPGGS